MVVNRHFSCSAILLVKMVAAEELYKSHNPSTSKLVGINKLGVNKHYIYL